MIAIVSVISKHILSCGISAYSAKISFIKGRKSGADFFNGRLRNKFVIASASHMHFRKRQIIAIRLLPKILDQIDNLLLVFAGKGPDSGRLKSEVKKLNLERYVLFVGVIPEDQLRSLYRQSKVVLLTSTEEPWGKVPFEALACGTIPLVSDQAGCAEVIDKEKIGIVAKSTASVFANEILYINQNPLLAKSMVRRGQGWVRENLTLDKYTKKTEKLFNSIIK